MINDILKGPELHDLIPIPDGAYGVPWRQIPVDLEELDLPMEDYAEYLTNTVSFTMGSLYYLFDKEDFLQKLHQFYADRSAGTRGSTDLWLIQMLLIFALGKSILAREASSHGPTGVAYISRAIEKLPHIHHLYQRPILSIEVLCLLCLCMLAMDMRLAAYDYVCGALGVSVEGVR